MTTKTEKKILLRIDPWSLAKVMTIICAILGFILGLIIAILGATFGSLMGFGSLGFIGAFAIIVFPIIYAIIGLLAGIVSALLYNVVAKWVGGVELEVKKK